MTSDDNDNSLILGLSDSHDAGICILKGNKILYAVNEERISRIKNQSGFPHLSIQNAIKKNIIDPTEVKFVSMAGLARLSDDIPTNNDMSLFNGKHLLSVKILSFLSSIYIFDILIRSKTFLKLFDIFTNLGLSKRKRMILNELKAHNIYPKVIHLFDHHNSHIISSFCASGFNKALVFSNDGMGDGICSKVALVDKFSIKSLSKNGFFNSLGILYGYASHLCGFKKNHHNGKTTGLAAHGNFAKTYQIFKTFIDWDSKKGIYYIKKGVFLKTLNDLQEKLKKFNKVDIAAGIQHMTDNLINNQITHFTKFYNVDNICLVGGLHANVTTNSKVINNNPSKNIFVFPNMSDGGLSLGAACLTFFEINKKYPDLKLLKYYLGDNYNDDEIKSFLNRKEISYAKNNNIEAKLGEILAKKKIVARYSGPMEYGPRALGNRSILYSASDKDVNLWLNKKLNRTETMPFAPIIMYEHAHLYVKNFRDKDLLTSRNMTSTFFATDLCIKNSPAAVHIDNTLRPQIILKDYNASLYKILDEYYKLTGVPLLINTSFNLHEEPIVRTPEEAYKAFLESDLDYLAMNKYIIKR